MSIYCPGQLTQHQDGYPLCSESWVNLPDLSDLLEDLVFVINNVSAFDVDVFQKLLVVSIVAFVTGHALGTIVRLIKRT